MSLLTFGFAQIAMDIEPLVRLVRRDAIVHGLTHTVGGAVVIGVVGFALGWPLCQYLARLWNRVIAWLFRGKSRRKSERESRQVSARSACSWLIMPTAITARAAALGAFLGTFTHILLDTIMHADMRPLWPISSSNPLLRALSLPELHFSCAILALICIPWVVVRERNRRLQRFKQE